MSENKILLKKQNRDAAALEKYKIIAPLLEDGMDSYAADRQLFARGYCGCRMREVNADPEVCSQPPEGKIYFPVSVGFQTNSALVL